MADPFSDPFADLGVRVELVSTDKYFRDVSIGLYATESDGIWCYRIRSFAKYDGIADRITYLLDAMVKLGGMVPGSVEDSVQFVCGGEHLVAVRRLFLQACKETPDATPTARTLSMWDKKSELTINAVNAGQGVYDLALENGENDRRLGALRNAMVKLADAKADEAVAVRFCFDCGHDHDPLVGLLLQAAPNVRAVMREYEMNAARGVLAAPGARE
ncbi:MAG: hypothetical protein HOO02_13700 [Rhodospirillaceae bacterium]|nr:hypothetical protein [Rhodospirillaceae bacterium]